MPPKLQASRVLTETCEAADQTILICGQSVRRLYMCLCSSGLVQFVFYLSPTIGSISVVVRRDATICTATCGTLESFYIFNRGR